MLFFVAEEPAVLKAQDPEVLEGEEAVGLLEATRTVPQFLREEQLTRKKGWHLFGVEMSPDTIAIAMVYFVQGILGLARLAVSYFLKDDLHLDPAEVKIFEKLIYNDFSMNAKAIEVLCPPAEFSLEFSMQFNCA